MPKGILLHGPPGTGKTLLAKAVATSRARSFFSQSASSFVEMFAGLGAARIRRLFDMRARRRPAIIFIDELDAVGAQRGFDISREKDQTLNQLLVEMDGFEDTRRPDRDRGLQPLEGLDPALLRPGRFDRQVLVSPPDLKGREQILNVHTRDKPLPRTSTSSMVARQTSGLTGADLANLCNEAAIFAGREDRDELLTARLRRRARAGRRGPADAPRDHRPREEGDRLPRGRSRALLASCCPRCDTVHKISIIPRGQALGYTLNLPEEDRYLMSKDELLDHMNGAARRPRRRADRVRSGHHRRLRRPAQGRTRSAAR